MKKKKLEKELKDLLRAAPVPERMEETAGLCRGIVREYPPAGEERAGFFAYLSEVFRHERGAILGLQSMALAVSCMGMGAVSRPSSAFPTFVTLFSLSAAAVLLRGQSCRMSEMEAATRASGAQIVLARLLLSGAASLVFLTGLLCLRVWLSGNGGEIGWLILYTLVPYLSCMLLMLRRIRLCRRGVLGTGFLCSAFWCLSAVGFPGLYEISAGGVWVSATLVFGGFFAREICYIWEMGKEGKMYGVID